MKYLLTLLLFVFSTQIFSQQGSTTVQDHKFDKIFTKVQKPASFPGGDISFQKYVHRNLNVKTVFSSLKETSQVAIVKFIVDTLGLVSNVSIVNAREINPTIAEEASKLIKRGPKWQPAVQNGRNVIYQVLQVITFPAISEAKDFSMRKETFDPVFTKVTNLPLFPGEVEGFKKYISENFNKEKLERHLKANSATVSVLCLLDKDGKILKATALGVGLKDRNEFKKAGYESLKRELSEEAVRLVETGPKWKPAKLDGKPVKYQLVVTVTFPQV